MPGTRSHAQRLQSPARLLLERRHFLERERARKGGAHVKDKIFA
jgi:hypothetical protein